MALVFNSLTEIESRYDEIMNRDDVLTHHEHINSRLEERLLHSVTVRDEIRRGVRISDEEIEVTIFEWLKRLLFKMNRFVELDAMVSDTKGILYVDVLEGSLRYEPSVHLEEFLARLQAKGIEGPFGVFQYPLNTKVLNQQVIREETRALNELYQGKSYPDQVIITYEDGRVCGLVKKVKEQVMAYGEVPAAHARREAQGDHSRLYWQLIHDVLYRRVLKEDGGSLTEDTTIYTMEFKLVTTPLELLFESE